MNCLVCGELIGRKWHGRWVKTCSSKCRGYYSTQGTKTIEEVFWSHVTKTESCWLWTGAPCRDGYIKYGHFKYRGVKYKAHRYSYSLHVGPVGQDLFVCHNCPGGDNPMCVNPNHLFIGNAKDNIQDCLKKGRHGYNLKPERWRKGEECTQSKLTEEDVMEIRSLKGKVRYIDLASRFGVSLGAIGSVCGGLSWDHLPSDPTPCFDLKRRTDYTSREVADAYIAGMTHSAIAAKFKINGWTVHRALEEFSIPRRRTSGRKPA